jgi:YD repeat-containing protein
LNFQKFRSIFYPEHETVNMKLILAAIACVLIAGSCRKSGSGSGNNNQTPYLDTVIVYTIGQYGNSLAVTHFTYDGSFRLLSANTNTNDTTSGSPITTFTNTSFTYNASDTIPSGYAIATINGANGTHLLSYDAQGRIIADSVNTGNVKHFTYGSGFIAGKTGNIADTVYTDGKNKTGYISYSSGVLTYQEGYYYSIYTNPFYFGRLANHIGYLFQPSFFDLASREICTSRQYILHAGDPNTNINYVWTNNSNSQVISGVGTNASTNKAVEYYTFTYRK